MEKVIYVVKIKYDGSNYSGWRRQGHTSNTIQQITEDALREISHLKVNLHAASWTDAGVHADGQVAAMVIRKKINTTEFAREANAILPNDIKIISIEPAPKGFDPIGGNLGKHYRYRICNGKTPPDNKCWHIPQQLDISNMQIAADKLVGTHDFSGIKQSKDRRKDCIRTISRCDISSKDDLIYIDFYGDNFIYLMIRSLTAALVEVATGHKEIEYIDLLLSTADNRFCPPPAPAQGLCLMSISF